MARLSSLGLIGIVSTCVVDGAGEKIPSWRELSREGLPEWIVESKFGIYTHWGLSTVQFEAESKGRQLTPLGAIERFTAEGFDAKEWAELFKDSGAQFAGPVSWHGSGFLHWESELSEWNAAEKGPKLDLVGELEREIRSRGMRFMMSYHFGYWYSTRKYEGNPEFTDPRFAKLYGPSHSLDATDVVKWKNHIEKQEKPSLEHQGFVLSVMKEGVRKYRPDLIWIDTSFGGTTRASNKGFYSNGKFMDTGENYVAGLREEFRRDFVGYYYDSVKASGREPVLIYKTHDVPPGVGMRNIENGTLDYLAYDPWMNDIDMCMAASWFYRPDVELKSADYLIDLLVDTVSKNGRMLLNVPPAADGRFPDEVQAILREMGDWLKVNGEAIYDTMPWIVYGEGPSSAKAGHYSDRHAENKFGDLDLRYTVGDDALYAICLGTPKGRISFKTLGSRGLLPAGEIESVTLLGSDSKVQWTHEDGSLAVTVPRNSQSKFAHVFKIQRQAVLP